MTNADAATALHSHSLMSPRFSKESVAIELDRSDASGDSMLSELPKSELVTASLPLVNEATEQVEVQHQTESVVDRRRPDVSLAGQNAVLLAKTQATAAWVQSETLWRQVQDMERQIVDERTETERTIDELAALRRELELERNERTAAQAASDELRQYLDQQQGHLGFLRDRIVSMESERDLQQSCLGWMGRRRFRRLLQQRWEANPRSALVAEGNASSVGNPLAVPDEPANQQFQPG